MFYKLNVLNAKTPLEFDGAYWAKASASFTSSRGTGWGKNSRVEWLSLGSCVEVSISGYPKIVRAQLAIPTELSILCGLAIGYPDPEFPANKLHIAREPIGENVVFLDN